MNINNTCKLGFGVMRLPLTNKKNTRSIDFEKSQKMVDNYIAAGFTHFDTSIIYHAGKSETALKKLVVDRYPRDSFTVTDKMPMVSVSRKFMLKLIFNTEIRRCGLSYFDFYWLHAVNAKNYGAIQRIGAFEFLKKKQREGKIKHIGFSFHDSAEVLDKILTEHPEAEYVQLQINYLDWESEKVQSRKCWETAVKHGRKIMIMEPVKGGTLINLPDKAIALLKEANPERTPAEWALSFCASLDNVEYVLSGMSTEEQIEENTKLFSDIKPLSDSERELLSRVAEIIKADTAVPCTACRYCTENCPQKIAIPEYFEIYNKLKRRGKAYEASAKKQFRAASKGCGKPSECKKCRQCEKHCPQNIPISELMEELTKAFEK